MRGGQRGRRVQLHAVQLDQRVDLHELNPGGGKNLAARHRLAQLLHHAVVAGVAVVARVFEQGSVGAEQGAVHAPGIDADAAERQLSLAGGHADAVLDLVPEAQRIPVKSAQDAHGNIGKAVQFFDRQFAAGERA